MASAIPLEPGLLTLPFKVQGREHFRGTGHHGTANWRSISPAYFRTLRIALAAGRLFTDEDDHDSPPVVLINKTMAKRYWQGSTPLGQEIVIGAGGRAEFAEPPRRVIGVVDDVRDLGLERDPEPTVYVPIAQVRDSLNAIHNRNAPMSWIVRTASASLHEIVRKQLTAASGLPLGRVRSMEEVIAESTSRASFNLVLLGVFAGIALVLAATGIYGMMAYSVEQRTREIGIRMAVGASPEDMRNLVLLEGMRLTGSGIVLGVASALALTRYMVSLIHGVKTWDPGVIALVALLLIAVSLSGAYAPARRATRVDPVDSLRS